MFKHINTMMFLGLLASISIQQRSAAESPEQPMPLTLGQAIELAIENSPDLTLVKFARGRNLLEAEIAQGQFSPTIFGETTYHQKTDTGYIPPAPGNTVGLYDRYSQKLLNYKAGVRGLLHWGMNYELRAQSDVQWSGALGAALTPIHISQLALELRQPLLRGRGFDANLATLNAARSLARASDHELQVIRRTLTQTTMQKYWRLVEAVRAMEIAQQGLDLSLQLFDLSEKRIQLGNLPRSALAEIRAEVEKRRESLSAIEATKLDREVDLLVTLMGAYSTEKPQETLLRSLSPSTKPVLPTKTLRWEELRQQAFAQRVELKKLQEERSALMKRLGAAKNAGLPGLDLVASGGLGSYAGSTALPQIPDELVGNHGTSWKQVFTADQPFFSIGAMFTLPLDGSLRKAEALRLQNDVAQFDVAYRRTQLEVMLSTYQAFKQFNVTRARVSVAEQAKQTAQENMQVAKDKFNGGIATAFDLIRAQELVIDAEQRFNQALIAHIVADTDLQAAIGTFDQQAPP